MKVVFLDRDGTVIVEPLDGNVDSVEKIQLLPDSTEALELLADNGFSAIFITNQKVIAEGRITADNFQKINAVVLDKLAPSGIKLLKTYVCPHSIDDNCECCKPSPKMILEAASDFKINLSESYMIGDRATDIMAGINAGTKTILVKTGSSPVTSDEATYTAPNLLDAVKYVVNN